MEWFGTDLGGMVWDRDECQSRGNIYVHQLVLCRNLTFCMTVEEAMH